MNPKTKIALLTVMLAFITASGSASSWWNSSWNYYTPFVLHIEKDVNAGYPFDLNGGVFNFGAKVNEGKMQADYDDLRIVCFDTNVTHHFEDDNSMPDQNFAWFRLDRPYAAGTAIDCNVYYGNAGATYDTSAADFNAVADDYATWLLYRFEQNDATARIFDSSGNNRDADANAPTNTITTSSGRFNRTLDAGKGAVNIKSRLNEMEAGTIEAMVYVPAATNGNRAIIGAWKDSSHKLYVMVNSENTLVFQTANWSINSAAPVPDDEWVHVAVGWGSSGVKMCVNGVEQGTNAATNALDSVSVDTYIGLTNENGTLLDFFGGLIDELRISSTKMAGCGEFYKVYDRSITQLRNTYYVTAGTEITGSLNTDFNYTMDLMAGTALTKINLLDNSTTGFSYSITGYEWFFNDTNKFATTEDATIYFPAAGTYKIAHRVTATNGITTVVEDNNKTITITAGHLQVYFRDENIGTAMTPGVWVNGTSTAITAGLLNIDLNAAIPQDYNVYAGSATHGGRTFMFYDVNQSTIIDINAVLLGSSLGKNIAFKFYAPDTATTLGSYYLSVFNTGGTEANDANYAEKLKLNASGETTLFLSTAIDQNYLFILSSGATKYFYPPIKTSILVPKDELTLAAISPFDMKIVAITLFSWLNQASWITFNTFSNTAGSYEIDVNASGYFQRNWFEQIKGNPADYNVQAYLAGTASNAIQTIIFVRNQTNSGISNVTIRTKRDVAGVGMITIEQKVTDATGETLFSFIQGNTYYLDFIYGGQTVLENIILRPIYARYDFYLYSQTFIVPDMNAAAFVVSFQPLGNMIDANTTIDLNFTANVNYATISIITITVKCNDTNTLFSGTTTTEGFYNIGTLGIAGCTILNPIIVEVTLTTLKGEVIKAIKSYSINSSSLQAGVYGVLTILLPAELNSTGYQEVTTLVAVIITIFLTGALGSSMRMDFTGATVFGLLILGFFVFINWVYWPVFVAACFTALTLILLTRGS